MQNGELYYTFNLYALDDEAVRKTDPFIVSEHAYDEAIGLSRSFETLGYAFPTPSDAMHAAKRLYFNRKYEMLGRAYRFDEKNYTPFYNVETGFIEAVNAAAPMPGGVYFDTEEEALKAVKRFEVEDFCHYVLGIRNVRVYVGRDV